MSKYFIDRPIMAMVVAMLTVIAGLVILARLPVAQFPSIVPPEVQIQATYVGADAQTIEQSVATPIEQQMSGVDNLNYMYSLNAAANGQMTMFVDFDVKTEPNTDLILSQMRTTQAVSQLPGDVTNYGVTVQKSVKSPLMVVELYSPRGAYDADFLANYAYINLNDKLTRIPGIGAVQVFGAGQYAMRIWVKPDRLAKLGITVSDVVSAIQTQNTVNPVGQVGGAPIPKGQEYTYSVRAQGRLSSPEEFEQIIIREGRDGGVVRVKDVARVALGVQDYTMLERWNGKPGVALILYQLPGSNAIEAAAAVKTLMSEARRQFPSDMDYLVTLDTTESVARGIHETTLTVLLAVILVTLVVYVFLQGWRATLIPLLAVPVSLVGTFIFFPLFGFSINTLSLLGLILAIGLVVDDAIVVVEAVQRHIEEGFAPREAALRAMKEISGPVIGIALVLSAVFIPTAFIPGITGRLYQQFAVTVAISVVISAFNALTLSPALAALLLRRERNNGGGLLRSFFDRFNHLFGRATQRYVRLSGILIRKTGLAFAMLALFSLGAAFFAHATPSGFLPDEDQGYLYLHVQLPNAASLERTDAVCKKIEAILARTPGVKHTTTVVGFNLLSFVRTSYNGLIFVTLNDWERRRDRAEQYQEILQRLNGELAAMPDGFAFSFSPPAIPGVGTAGGFTFLLEDRAGKDVPFLASNLNTFLAAAQKRPEIGGLFSTFLPGVPQQFVDVDKEKALKQGVQLNDVYRTLQGFMGGLFINYFNRFGRQWQVYLQAEGDYRTSLDNVGRFYVRSNNGSMVPLSALTKVESRPGPEFTMRYNLYRSAQIVGAAAPGYSSAQAMNALEEVFAQTMPSEMGYDYMDMSFQEKQAQKGVSPLVVFGVSLLFVFLILAALYESWILPVSVLLSTPVAVFGAFGLLWLRRFVTGLFLPPYRVQIENNVFSQIGLVMLIGLAAKNAILIVEFARERYRKGAPLYEAALEAARLRLRPILMTSFAFILGCVPLWTASGSGSLARQIMGTTVIGGMLALSLFGIFLIPVFFCAVEKLGFAPEAARSTAPSSSPDMDMVEGD